MFRLGLLRNGNDENMMRGKQRKKIIKKSLRTFLQIWCDKNSRPEEKKTWSRARFFCAHILRRFSVGWWDWKHIKSRRTKTRLIRVSTWWMEFMRSEAGAEITTENIHLKLSHRRIVYELLIVVTNHIPHDCVFGLSCVVQWFCSMCS